MSLVNTLKVPENLIHFDVCATISRANFHGAFLPFSIVLIARGVYVRWRVWECFSCAYMLATWNSSIPSSRSSSFSFHLLLTQFDFELLLLAIVQWNSNDCVAQMRSKSVYPNCLSFYVAVAVTVCRLHLFLYT